LAQFQWTLNTRESVSVLVFEAKICILVTKEKAKPTRLIMFLEKKGLRLPEEKNLKSQDLDNRVWHIAKMWWDFYIF
jgi:hypothetical protein